MCIGVWPSQGRQVYQQRPHPQRTVTLPSSTSSSTISCCDRGRAWGPSSFPAGIVSGLILWVEPSPSGEPHWVLCKWPGLTSTQKVDVLRSFVRWGKVRFAHRGKWVWATFKAKPACLWSLKSVCLEVGNNNNNPKANQIKPKIQRKKEGKKRETGKWIMKLMWQEKRWLQILMHFPLGDWWGLLHFPLNLSWLLPGPAEYSKMAVGQFLW